LTGGGSGIGRLMALKLAKESYRLKKIVGPLFIVFFHGTKSRIALKWFIKADEIQKFYLVMIDYISFNIEYSK
jgi:hypothetical protein